MVDWTYAVAFLWEIHEKAMRKTWETVREVNRIPRPMGSKVSGGQGRKIICKLLNLKPYGSKRYGWPTEHMRWPTANHLDAPLVVFNPFGFPCTLGAWSFAPQVWMAKWTHSMTKPWESHENAMRNPWEIFREVNGTPFQRCNFSFNN